MNEEDENFYIVEFAIDKKIEIVPADWIKRCDGLNYCLWPPYEDPKHLLHAVVERDIPDDNWKEYEISREFAHCGK